MNLARLVFAGFWFDKSSEEEALQLARKGVGGFCLYGGTAASVAALTRKLRRISPQLLFAADYEDGLGRWLPDRELLPSNLALGAVADESLAFEKGFITARQALELGVNWVFAPVVDLADNAANPIVNTRSFGQDPHLVTRMAGAFMKGLHAGGVLNCLKHFPGHGNTTTDSHLALPVIPDTFSHLQTHTLVPFKQLLDVADSVMTGHLLVPALDAQQPASLSAAITRDLLCKQLGFSGCVCTDALLMRALGDEQQAALQALKAGAHVLLVPQDPAGLIDFLQRQTLPAEVVARATAKLDALSARAEQLAQNAQKKEFSALDFMQRTAAKALAGQGKLPRLTAGETVHLLEVGNDDAISCTPFTDTLRAGGVSVRPFTDDADTLIILWWRRYQAFSGRIGLTGPEEQQLRSALQRAKHSVLVCFGNPWMASSVTADGTLFVFSPSAVFQQAAAHCLTGALQLTGCLPVSL